MAASYLRGGFNDEIRNEMLVQHDALFANFGRDPHGAAASCE
jgi:hypothetical protein